ncbi:C2 domain [Plasmopara halstedii]|uniref:C2 domain n=1 Tax=Plasmopara halstedii TaxID=4781 RepID=A0A0P1A6V3_PLAHL|nr:C2 domain [Plasmopara halstedii]CEG36342.1 C2 domain [Plasmopara halstedii]|eukprot:XP_024572711.1 C2 domain [Plasmopara halstedii]
MTRKSNRRSQRKEATTTHSDPTHTAEPSSDSSSSSSEFAPEVRNLPIPIVLKPASPSKPTPKQPSPLLLSPTKKNGPEATIRQIAESNDTMNGTIHVKVLTARNLPMLDFGKRQDPFVMVQLNNSVPKSWATTDPSFHGGANPEWTERSNNELELFYNASVMHDKGTTLTFEVYSDESGDELIGSAQQSISSIVENRLTKPTAFTIHLSDEKHSNGNRGELNVEIWFGPPVRKVFRAAGRAFKLLDARDAMVAMLCSMTTSACGAVSDRFQLPMDFAKSHRKLSMALAVVFGFVAAAALTMFVAFAVPALIVAFITFPFWIIPVLVTSFFTAPLWLPILLLIGLFLLFISSFVFGLGITSGPVRRKSAFILNKIKHSEIGKRVIYEKSA